MEARAAPGVVFEGPWMLHYDGLRATCVWTYLQSFVVSCICRFRRETLGFCALTAGPPFSGGEQSSVRFPLRWVLGDCFVLMPERKLRHIYPTVADREPQFTGRLVQRCLTQERAARSLREITDGHKTPFSPGSLTSQWTLRQTAVCQTA